jgi:hypothetical protein
VVALGLCFFGFGDRARADLSSTADKANDTNHQNVLTYVKSLLNQKGCDRDKWYACKYLVDPGEDPRCKEVLDPTKCSPESGYWDRDDSNLEQMRKFVEDECDLPKKTRQAFSPLLNASFKRRLVYCRAVANPSSLKKKDCGTIVKLPDEKLVSISSEHQGLVGNSSPTVNMQRDEAAYRCLIAHGEAIWRRPALEDILK